MLARDFLSHASSDGTGMAQRVRRYTGANWIGENIAAVSGRATARRAVRMWMQSPPHRAVLLSPSGRRIGVGKRRGQARERAPRGLHGRSRLARLSAGRGAVPDSIAPR